MSNRSQQLKLAAEIRAAIHAFFKRQGLAPELSTSEVAAAVGRETKLVRQQLIHMEANGFVIRSAVSGRDILWKSNLTPEKTASTDFVHHALETGDTLQAHFKGGQDLVESKGVELCFGDVTVIVGKNPQTGRIRVTIE